MKRLTTFIYKGQSYTICKTEKGDLISNTICKTEKGDLISHTLNPVKLIGLIVAIPDTNIKPDGTMKRSLTIGEMYNDLNPVHNTLAYITESIIRRIDMTEFIKENNINLDNPSGVQQLFEYLSNRR